MLLLLLFYLVVALVVIYEVRPLAREGARREIVAFSVLMGLATVYSTLLILRLPAPNPQRAIEAVFEPIGRLIIPK